jgi:hypothetical protein
MGNKYAALTYQIITENTNKWFNVENNLYSNILFVKLHGLPSSDVNIRDISLNFAKFHKLQSLGFSLYSDMGVHNVSPFLSFQSIAPRFVSVLGRLVVTVTW